MNDSEDDEVFQHPISDTLDLHAFQPRDVQVVVQEYLRECAEHGFRFVRIIHGKGIGLQREIVRSILEKSDLVESFEEGPDWGSTAVKLRLTAEEH